MRRVIIGLVIAVVALLVIGTVGFLVVTSNPSQPMPQALDALKSDSQVDVSTTPWFVFKPRTSDATTGFIFYPGGLVDPRAYAPLAREIAASGYLVVIVPMPFNLAFFDANRASEVIAKYPAIKRWAIGGHSLGGVAAAMFVQSHPNVVQGIAFWASYPPDRMTDSRIAVLSISGTQDGLSTPTKIDASRELFPMTTRFVTIEGGNHAQFGWYGVQSGDGVATISREEQQKQIVGAMLDWLKRLEN